MIINIFARKLKLNKQGRERCFLFHKEKGRRERTKQFTKTEKWRIGICWYVLLNGMANNFRLLHGCFSFKYGRNDSHQNIFDSKSRYLQWKKKKAFKTIFGIFQGLFSTLSNWQTSPTKRRYCQLRYHVESTNVRPFNYVIDSKFNLPHIIKALGSL